MFAYFMIGVLVAIIVTMAIAWKRERSEQEAFSELLGAHSVLSNVEQVTEEFVPDGYLSEDQTSSAKLFLLDVLHTAYYHTAKEIHGRYTEQLDKYAAEERPKIQVWEHPNAQSYRRSERDEVAIAMLIADSGSPPWERANEGKDK